MGIETALVGTALVLVLVAWTGVGLLRASVGGDGPAGDAARLDEPAGRPPRRPSPIRPQPSLRSILPDLAWALPLYGVLTVVMTWPLAKAPASTVLDRTQGWLFMDINLVLWILATGTASLATNPAGFAEGQAFHPFPHAIARSEHLLGDQPLFAPVYLATGNPVLAFNLMLLGSFVLSAIAMHLLIRSWSGRRGAAVVAALAWAFVLERLELGRPHLVQVYWLPLAVLFLDRALRMGRPRDATAGGVLLSFQYLSSFYLAYVSMVVVGCFFLGRLAVAGVSRRGLAAGIAALLVAAVPLALTSLPYLKLARGGEIAAYVAPGGPSWSATVWIFALLSGLPHLPVWFVTLSMVGGVALGARLLDLDSRSRAMGATLAILAGFVLSAGPRSFGSTWLDPWGWFAAVVPGFAQMRVPTRMMIAASFGASTLVGLGFAWWETRIETPRARWLFAIVTSSILLWPGAVAQAPMPRRMPIPGTLPPVYARLQSEKGDGAVLELPIDANLLLGKDILASMAMYLGIFHGKPVINGYTGFPPVGYAKVEALARRLPAPDAVDVLVRCADLRWVVDHASDPKQARSWSKAGFRLVGRFPGFEGQGTDSLWEIAREHTEPCPAGMLDAG